MNGGGKDHYGGELITLGVLTTSLTPPYIKWSSAREAIGHNLD